MRSRVGRREVTGDCSYFLCLASACFAEDSLAIMKGEISTNGKLIIYNLGEDEFSEFDKFLKISEKSMPLIDELDTLLAKYKVSTERTKY
jgi:hypothetical protein